MFRIFRSLSRRRRAPHSGTLTHARARWLSVGRCGAARHSTRRVVDFKFRESKFVGWTRLAQLARLESNSFDPLIRRKIEILQNYVFLRVFWFDVRTLISGSRNVLAKKRSKISKQKALPFRLERRSDCSLARACEPVAARIQLCIALLGREIEMTASAMSLCTHGASLYARISLVRSVWLRVNSRSARSPARAHSLARRATSGDGERARESETSRTVQRSTCNFFCSRLILGAST